MPSQRSRIARALLAVLGITIAARAGEVTPRRLDPDAMLPERSVEVELPPRRWNPTDEAGQAAEVVRAYAQHVGLVQDPAIQQRVEAIGHRVITAAKLVGPAQVAVGANPDVPLRFTFRVLDTQEVNAFSVWDGNIYLTRGMLDLVESDHELAAVLAHEVAHSTLHHLRDQVRRYERYTLQQMVALLAAMVIGANMAHAALGAQMVHAALMSGHRVEAETEADYVGCFYAYRAGYDPVGAITVFERLHRLSQRSAQPEVWGIAQTHPWSDQRAERLEAQIRALGLPVNRRAVSQGLSVGYRTVPGAAGGPATVELLLGATPVYHFAPDADDPERAQRRAADQATAFNRALWLGMRASQLELAPRDDGFVLRAVMSAGPVDLLSIAPADAAARGLAVAEYADRTYRHVLARLRTEELNNGSL